MIFRQLQLTLSAFLLSVLAAVPYSSAYNGHLTFYGWAGQGNTGACTSDFKYPGWTTIAMNNPQYKAGQSCGGCVKACYRYKKDYSSPQTFKRCFKAVVNNACPGCPFSNIDLAEAGDGYWPVEWKYIPCPGGYLRFRTQGSNPWYGKLKVEGAGRVVNVRCEGRNWRRSIDGYWLGTPNGKLLSCGITCSIRLDFNRLIVRRIPGYLFGGGCNGR